MGCARLRMDVALLSIISFQQNYDSPARGNPILFEQCPNKTYLFNADHIHKVHICKFSMTNVENLETWSIALFYHTQAQAVNIQRCSIIILHNGGGDGGEEGEFGKSGFIPISLPDKPTKRLQGVFADLRSRQSPINFHFRLVSSPKASSKCIFLRWFCPRQILMNADHNFCQGI